MNHLQKVTTNRHQSNSRKPRLCMTARLAAHILNLFHKKSCLSWWKRWRSGREPSARRVVLVTWPGTWLGTRELRRTKPTTSAQDSGADQGLRSKFQAFNIIAGSKGLREREVNRGLKREYVADSGNLRSTRTLGGGLSYISDREMPYSLARDTGGCRKYSVLNNEVYLIDTEWIPFETQLAKMSGTAHDKCKTRADKFIRLNIWSIAT